MSMTPTASHPGIRLRNDGVSARIVRRIKLESPVTTSEIAVRIEPRRIGRPSIAARWTQQGVAWLRVEYALPALEILRRPWEVHRYPGSKSALYEPMRRLHLRT